MNEVKISENEKIQGGNMLYEVVLVRNPKVGKGWVYNLSKECWMRAIKPEFARNGVLVKGIFVLNEAEKYLVRIDKSSWKNQWETYLLLTVKNGGVITLASWERNNGNYVFSNQEIQQHFINYSLTQPQTSDNPNQQVVKVNVLEFAKYLAKLI